MKSKIKQGMSVSSLPRKSSPGVAWNVGPCSPQAISTLKIFFKHLPPTAQPKGLGGGGRKKEGQCVGYSWRNTIYDVQGGKGETIGMTRKGRNSSMEWSKNQRKTQRIHADVKRTPGRSRTSLGSRSLMLNVCQAYTAFIAHDVCHMMIFSWFLEADLSKLRCCTGLLCHL